MAENPNDPGRFSLRWPLAFSALLLGYIALVTAWAWTLVPSGASVPIHWNAAGVVDGYGDKATALLPMPLIALGLTIILALIPILEPRRRHLIASRSPYVLVWLGLLGLMAALTTLIALSAQGYRLEVGAIIIALVALLFVMIGAVLPGVRSNFFFGVRTPWTLSSELAWTAAHRLAGHLFVASGLVVLAALILDSLSVATLALGIGIAVSSLASIVYSYLVWRTDPNKQTIGR